MLRVKVVCLEVLYHPSHFLPSLKKHPEYTLNEKIIFLTVQKQLSPKFPKCNQFRKVNIACPIFKKYGKCKLKDKNRCKFSHNPNNVNICRRFLVGACDIISCNLSHQVTMENVPTCKFFLRNMCVNENCPYLHIKVDSNANLCPDFLNGFCKAGEKVILISFFCQKTWQMIWKTFLK